MIEMRKGILTLTTAAFLLLGFAVVTGAQESSKPISAKGLEDALKIGGLQTNELVGIISKRGVDFILTPDVEQQLRTDGASSAVIDAVRTHFRSPDAAASSSITSVTPPSSRGSASGSVPSAPGVFYKDTSGWVQLRPESATWHHGGLMHNLSKDTGGMLHGEMTGEVAGTHSPATMHSPASFMIRTAKGAMLEDYLLIHLHEKHDNRNFKIALGGTSSADSVDFRAAKITDNLYEIDFTQGAGEYAFMTRSVAPADGSAAHNAEVLTFRVLE